MADLAVYAAGIAGVAAVSSTHATSLTFAAIHPALALSVVLLIAGALACLLLRRSPAPAAVPRLASQPRRQRPSPAPPAR